MTKINTRFRDFIEKTGLVPSKFAVEIGVNHESINRLFRESDLLPSINLIMAAKRRFPTLNVNHLITGEETMFMSEISLDIRLAKAQQEIDHLKALVDSKDEIIKQLATVIRNMQDAGEGHDKKKGK